MHERLAVESSFRFRLIGPEVLVVVSPPELIFAVVLGASALSNLEILSFARVFDLSDNFLEKLTEFILLQGKLSDATNEKALKKKERRGHFCSSLCVCFFVFFVRNCSGFICLVERWDEG